MQKQREDRRPLVGKRLRGGRMTWGHNFPHSLSEIGQAPGPSGPSVDCDNHDDHDHDPCGGRAPLFDAAHRAKSGQLRVEKGKKHFHHPRISAWSNPRKWFAIPSTWRYLQRSPFRQPFLVL